MIKAEKVYSPLEAWDTLAYWRNKGITQINIEFLKESQRAGFLKMLESANYPMHVTTKKGCKIEIRL